MENVEIFKISNLHPYSTLCRRVFLSSKTAENQRFYSTVTEYSGYGVIGYFNSLLCFDMNLSSQNLLIPNYSTYQHFLYETITEMRNKGNNDVQIANWLNDNGYKTPRGNTFRNNHVHSIAKKRKRRLEIQNTEPSMSISNLRIYLNKIS